MVSSHGSHGVATGDDYYLEILMNYMYMLFSCATPCVTNAKYCNQDKYIVTRDS